MTSAYLKRWSMPLALLTLLGGCHRSTANVNVQDTTTDTNTEVVNDSASDQQVQTLFDDGSVLRIEITLPADEWTQMQATAQEEVYHPVEAVIDGAPLGTVGLRFKGSYGALYNCIDDQGNLICPKLSLKMKFNKFVENTRFQGLKRLNLHAMSRNPSLMAEHLAYRAFRDMGIHTARTAYAELTVNGEYMGVYGVVEQIDGRFTDDRFFPNGNGNLFKERWPKVPDKTYLQEGLKTNENLPDFSGMIAFTNALQNAAEADLPTLIEQYIDVDYWITYLAVNEAINNWDGVGTWYCDQPPCFPHNFYIYQEEKRPFFWLLPWDMDSTFIPYSWNGYPPRWNDLNVDCDVPMPLVNIDSNAMPPSCDPLMRGLALQDPKLYKEAINKVLDTVLDEQQLLTQIDHLEALLTPLVKKDPVWDFDAWHQEVTRLRGNIPLLRQRLMLLRDGEDVSPAYLPLNEPVDFENMNQIRLATTMVTYANPGTAVQLTVDEEPPLAGNKSLTMNVDFADAEKEYGSWAVARWPFGETADLTNLTTLQITLKSDAPRWVLLSLESPLATTESSGVSWGFNIQTTGAPQTLTLTRDDLSLPWWYTPNGNEDPLDAILKKVTAIRILPMVADYNGAGHLPDGETAAVTIDNLAITITP